MFQICSNRVASECFRIHRFSLSLSLLVLGLPQSTPLSPFPTSSEYMLIIL